MDHARNMAAQLVNEPAESQIPIPAALAGTRLTDGRKTTDDSADKVPDKKSQVPAHNMTPTWAGY